MGAHPQLLRYLFEYLPQLQCYGVRAGLKQTENLYPPVRQEATSAVSRGGFKNTRKTGKYSLTWHDTLYADAKKSRVAHIMRTPGILLHNPEGEG